MPRYFFDVSNARFSAEDEAGADFNNIEEAEREAIAGIRSILKDELEDGLINFNGEVRILDERRQLVRTVPYAKAVTIVSKSDIRAPETVSSNR